MGSAFNSLAGGVGRLGGDILHGNWGGAAADIGRDIAGAPGWIGSALSGFGGQTGQPAGGPSSTPALMSQGAPSAVHPNGGGGMSGAPLSAGLAGAVPGYDAGDPLLGAGVGGYQPGSPIDLQTPSAVSQATAAQGGFNLGNFLTHTALPAASIGYEIYRNNQGIPMQKELKGLAGGQAGLAHSLQEGALQEMQGNLPGGAEVGIQQGLEAAKAAIRSKYANMGLTGSTMEGQDIANADMAATAQRFAIGQQMATEGLAAAQSAESIASNLYAMIMEGQIQQGTALGDALAGFAGAAVPQRPVVG